MDNPDMIKSLSEKFSSASVSLIVCVMAFSYSSEPA